MNKELKKYIRAIEQLNIGVRTVYFDFPGNEKPQANIKGAMFDDWFDEYELARHSAGRYWQKTAYCEGIKFYALYSLNELKDEDREKLKGLPYEEIEAL